MSNKDNRTEFDVSVQSEVQGVVAKLDNIDMLFGDPMITTELPALDRTIVDESFTLVEDVFLLAGQEVKFTWSRYGHIKATLYVDEKKYPLKGQTLKAVLKKLYENYFYKSYEQQVDAKWNLIYGQFTFGKKANVKFLWRGETLIGIYKEDTSVARTIKWYERAVYKGQAPTFNRVHKTVDFKQHIEHEVYDTQSPEFTREPELEEIRGLIASLKRRLSNEEQDIINDIASEIDKLRTL